MPRTAVRVGYFSYNNFIRESAICWKQRNILLMGRAQWSFNRLILPGKFIKSNVINYWYTSRQDGGDDD
jgi:hypothetical protein